MLIVDPVKKRLKTVLKKFNGSIFSSETCKKEVNENLHPGVLCAGNLREGGIDSCQVLMMMIMLMVVMMVMMVNNDQIPKVSDYRMQVLDELLYSQLFGRIMVEISISFNGGPIVHKMMMMMM